ncbi:HTH-type transcriptional activator IlvY [Teredinibacter sp. KSP-S5-2]|uniref:HTH-type transcriptional activator IlvY n=1 Tax=Teredinibacter sp. KSP-S5-2 TaxID=3034506 RepID=UPI0029348D51|nr:HTH-type transcriptional activator IlvY [Teredinibacter sp. KSP-S5-2]WNO09881.1 HTH-type transcriptional activator IlvY [Teredinibacter sp. KSP-S5-2]
MDTSQLKHFITLASTRHFGKAAEQCFISPSTLSRSIKQLEEELKVQLFERDNRTVELTAQGKQFQQYANDAYQQLETIKEALIAENGELQGAISIYCSITASYSFLFNFLTEFRQRHPLIEIKLHTGDPADAIQRVTGGQEDLAIAAKPERLPVELEFKRITHSPLILIISKTANLPIPHTVQDVDTWQKLPVILSEKGIAREQLDAWFRSHKIQPNIYAQVSGNEAIVSMVSLGFGIGLVPEIVLNNSPLRDQVEHFPIQPQIKPYQVGVCCLKKRLKSPIVAALWEQIANKAE